MQVKLDSIQFESRAELGDLIKAVEKYVKAFPEEKNNKTLKDFYDCLDVIEMSW